MSAGFLLQAVPEHKLRVDLESQPIKSDDEAVLLTARESQDQASHRPARFALRRSSTFFALASAFLLAVAIFTASIRDKLWPGLQDTSHATDNKVATRLFSEANKLAKEKERAPFDVHLLKAVFDEPSANTFFKEIQMHDGTVSYRHRSGLLVTAKKGQYVKSSPSVPGSTQFFGKTTNQDGTISLMVHGGSWLTALPSGEIVADGANISAWQTFSQKRGENGTVALRNSHGKYMGLNHKLSEEFIVDGNTLMKDYGFGCQATAAKGQITAAEALSVIVMAQAKSIGSREKFTMIKNTPDDTVSLKTKYGTFLRSPMEGLVSGDSTIACGRESFTLILKHRKVYLRTFDGWYITAHRRGFLVGDAIQPGLQESFDMESNNDGTVSLKTSHGKYFRAINMTFEADVSDWAYPL